MFDSNRQGHREGKQGFLGRAWTGIKKGVKAGWEWAGSDGLDMLLDAGGAVADAVGITGVSEGLGKAKELNQKARDIKGIVKKASGVSAAGVGSGGGPGLGMPPTLPTGRKPGRFQTAPMLANMSNPAAGGNVNQSTSSSGRGPGNSGVRAPAPDLNATRMTKRSRFSSS